MWILNPPVQFRAFTFFPTTQSAQMKYWFCPYKTCKTFRSTYTCLFIYINSASITKETRSFFPIVPPSSVCSAPDVNLEIYLFVRLYSEAENAKTYVMRVFPTEFPRPQSCSNFLVRSLFMSRAVFLAHARPYEEMRIFFHLMNEMILIGKCKDRANKRSVKYARFSKRLSTIVNSTSKFWRWTIDYW